jgi:DNA-binding XRE family transcriptional regulator
MILNGAKIKSLRQKASLSQFDLSYEINMNRELISKLENGRRANTSLETAYKLSKYFNVTIEELL